MIIDGKKIASDILMELKRALATRTTSLTLAIITVGNDPVTASFVRIKKRIAGELGVAVHEIVLPKTSTEDEVVAEIQTLSRTPSMNGIIVQLPLPASMSTDRVLAAIPAKLDVDVLGGNESALMAPVAAAVFEILSRSAIVLEGRKVVIVGHGRLVGKPIAHAFRTRGIDPVVIPQPTENLAEITKAADIIILGAGSPALLQPHMIREGVVIIDAGTSEQGGKIVGDADPACAEHAAVFSPVPGGVGPIAVAMIFKNLLILRQP